MACLARRAIGDVGSNGKGNRPAHRAKREMIAGRGSRGDKCSCTQ